MKQLIVVMGRLALVIVACALGLATTSEAQKKPPAPTVKVVDFGKPPPPGKWQSLCPKLQLPADKSSIKTVAADGSVVGSGYAGQKPSISKCANGSVVWRKTVNTIPTSLATHYGRTFFAGMSRKRGLAVDVGEFTGAGTPVWAARVDGPGDEGNASIAPGVSGFYVFGASSGALPGQPAGAKGHRFLAFFDSQTRKRKWLKQTKDFGKGSVEAGSALGPTPATMATDGAGNVYVLSSLDPNARAAKGKGPLRLATLVKFDRAGKQLWRTIVSVDLSSVKADSFSGNLTAMTVDGDGSSIYLAGDALRNSHSELIVMRLDHMGRPRWTKLVSLAFVDRSDNDDGGQMSISGDTRQARGIGVFCGDLFVVAEYENFYVETSGEEEDEEFGLDIRDRDHVAAVAAFHSVDGELQWARLYSGLGREYGSASEFLPTGLRVLQSGAIAVTGRDEIYDTRTNKRFEDVASAFVLTDAKAMIVQSEYPPTAVELEFFQRVQRAMEAGDKQWLAANVEYPLAVGAEDVIKTRAEFVKRYDSIVTERVRKAVAAEVGNQLWRQEPTWQRDGGLIVGNGELTMSEGTHIAIAHIGGGTIGTQPADEPAEPVPSTPAAATPTEEAQPKVASEEEPAAAPQKGKKELRREKMKKFFEDPDKKTQKK